MDSTPSSDAADASSRFMRRAIELARFGMEAGDGGPFGCVIVKDDAIVGEGWNRVVIDNDPTAHGEIVAIRDACRRLGTFQLTGCDLYTSAEPCPMCLSAIYWARPERIYFACGVADAAAAGFDDQFIYDELSQHHTTRRIPRQQILASESAAVFADYVHKANRVHY